MSRPLAGCTITGSLKNPAPGFSAVASSLLYQSNALGMRFESTANASADAQLSFELKTPCTSAVMCEVTAWADTAVRAGTENVIQAASGLMSVHGRSSGKAQPLGLNYVSTLTAALALQGGIASVIGQLRGASVSRSSVSMASAALLSIGQYLAGATAPEHPEMILPGSTSPGAHPPFISSDGVVFELETLDAEPWQKFWAKVGVDSESAGRGWTAFLLRYAKAIAPLPAALITALTRLTFGSISEICASTGMSVCPVRSIGERSRDEEAKGMWLHGPWEFLPEPKPNGVPPGRVANDLPLSGLTVIESCRRIQGPLAGHLLALLGADVIRIEPPGGDPLRGMPPMAEGVSARFDALNRLKTVREINIKTSRGQDEIKELVRHADVFLHNWAPGKAASSNLDHTDLARINPSLIYAYAGGWGASTTQHAIPGTDFMAQAYSGVAQKIAGASGTLGGSLFTVLDVLGGVVAAQGITVALLGRCMNNTVAKVETSLLGAATLLCADDLHNLYNPPRTPSTPGSVIDAVYPTRHGQVAIECRDLETAKRLAEAIGLFIGVDEEDFHTRLASILLTKTADEWAAALEKARVPSAAVVEDITQLQTNARSRPCLSIGSYTRVDSPWRFK